MVQRLSANLYTFTFRHPLEGEGLEPVPAKAGSEGGTEAPPHPDLLPGGEKELSVPLDSRLRGNDGLSKGRLSDV